MRAVAGVSWLESHVALDLPRSPDLGPVLSQDFSQCSVSFLPCLAGEGIASEGTEQLQVWGVWRQRAVSRLLVPSPALF